LQGVLGNLSVSVQSAFDTVGVARSCFICQSNWFTFHHFKPWPYFLAAIFIKR
jgi:hypothetical protein